METNIISKILYNENFRQYIRFGIVGTFGTLLNLTILFVFTDIFGIYYIYSEVVAFIASVIHNYLLNKKWTFKESIQEEFVPKLINYTIICIFVLIINLTVLFILVEYFGIWYIFAEVGAILAQVIEIERTNSTTIADCSIIGFRTERGFLRKPRTPLEPGSDIFIAEDKLIICSGFL